MGEASRPPAPGALAPTAHVARARSGRRGAGAPVRNSNRDVELVANAEHHVADARPDLIGKLSVTPNATCRRGSGPTGAERWRVYGERRVSL